MLDYSSQPNGGIRVSQMAESLYDQYEDKNNHASQKKERLDYDKIKEIYNTTLTKANNIRKLTDSRKKLVKKLFDENDLNYEKFENYLAFLNSSQDAQWMFERRPRENGGYWNVQTFEYFVSEKCLCNVYENYL